MNQKLELLQGTLDLLILRTLLGGAAHGHAIAKYIQRTSEELLQVESGSLYPVMSESQICLRLLALPLASQLGVTQRNVARNRLLIMLA